MPMAITADKVKALREKTGAGMMECKKALTEAGGDMEKAITLLRERGAAVAAKRAARTASEGTIGAYVHQPGSKIGVLVELNCETAPVAKTDEFQQLARDIAMQISWSKPQYITREEVPQELLEKEREIHRQWAIREGKPEKVLDKIVAGRLETFYREVCLLDQPFIRDNDLTIQDLINQAVGKIGEKIVVRRFVRFAVGEEMEGDEATGLAG
jgi:elongation factor Ts